MLVTCRECASSISTSAAACPRCGAPPNVFLGTVAPCAECGTDYRPAFDACQNCGAPRSVAQPGARQSVDEPVATIDGRLAARARPEPWARWGAKWIDLAIFVLLWSVAFGYLGYDWYGESAEFGFFLFTAVTFPFWDGFIVALSSGSIGRAVFRFSVRVKGHATAPSLGKSVARAWGAWTSGCGLGIPLVNIFTGVASKLDLEKHGQSGWDREVGTEVVHEGSAWWSWLILVAVILLVLSLNVYAQNNYSY